MNYLNSPSHAWSSMPACITVHDRESRELPHLTPAECTLLPQIVSDGSLRIGRDQGNAGACRLGPDLYRPSRLESGTGRRAHRWSAAGQLADDSGHRVCEQGR
jgi:hypothetical protein